jgi:hypothetical protein
VTLLAGTPFTAWASDDITGREPILLCEACRDPYDHPRDFGNYVFNQTTGDNPTLTMAEANQVLVCNEAGQWAMVDLDFELTSTGLMFQFGWIAMNLSVPSSDIRISVQDPAGIMTSYNVFSYSPPLAVGDEAYSPASDTDSSTDPAPQIESEGDEDESVSSGGGGEYYSTSGDLNAGWSTDGAFFWFPSSSTSEFPNDLE